MAAHIFAEGDASALAHALAASTAPMQRRWAWPLELTRVQASPFLEWCHKQGINRLQDRLPYGRVARYLPNHELLPGTTYL